MRANPAQYQLLAPPTLSAVLSLLAQNPGAWLPIAGGTDVMVQYSAGKLAARKLVSLWHLPELRRIAIFPTETRIGAAATYTDLRQNDIIAREFSLLSTAAAWTGGIANQNRGTLGGNIINASPAADSLPALLVYEADLILISARGERRVPYSTFHTAYRKTQLAPDELLRAICLPRRFSGYYAHARKVGARNAQAIAKVCFAALAHLEDDVAETGVLQTEVFADVRLAVGSVTPVPLRLSATERLLKGKRLDAQLLRSAAASAAAEIKPIDDIRSTARYRSAVTGNLVAEFLQQLSANHARHAKASALLSRWNTLPSENAAAEILICCGSIAWARGLAARRPIHDEAALLAASDQVWNSLPEAAWLEAFRSHPRIGESHSPASTPAQSATWSGQEQQRIASAEENIKNALAEGNRAYEKRFGRIFIICASGKFALEILEILRRRLLNDAAAELREAAEQQRQIAQLRLKKWLDS